MIKFKFGIVFLATFTIVSLAIGAYFLKLYPLFSIIFFLAAIINSILCYKEYRFQNKTSINKDNTPEETKIKYPVSNIIVTILTYSVFPVVAIFGLTISRTQFNLNNSSAFMIITLFISAFIIASYLEIKKKSNVFIVINDEGIQLGNTPAMKWKEIQQEKIISRNIKGQDYRRNYTAIVNYLYLFYNDQKVEVEIDDFNITDYDLAQLLKKYRELYNKQNSLS
nr:hypothetical protein [uncultured Chryseobacterium sp.]